MRKPLVFGAVLLWCTAGVAADPVGLMGKAQSSASGAAGAKTGQAAGCASDKAVLDLVVIASNQEYGLAARTTAIDQIGNSGKAALAVPALRRLLNDPPVTYAEWESFVDHIVRALGKFHSPEVCDAIPDLVVARGRSTDRTVRGEIDHVLETLNFVAEPTGVITAQNVSEWHNQLVGDGGSIPPADKAEVRLDAAKKLAGVTNLDLVSDALSALDKAIQQDSDLDVRRVAATSARTILGNLKDRATPAYAKNYAAALAERLKTDDILKADNKSIGSVEERVAAALALQEFFSADDHLYSKKLDCVPAPLVVAANSTNKDPKDPKDMVKAAAQSAVDAFVNATAPKPAPVPSVPQVEVKPSPKPTSGQ